MRPTRAIVMLTAMLLTTGQSLLAGPGLLTRGVHLRQPVLLRPAQLRIRLPARTAMVAAEDASGSYRTLGIPEDATYDEIMDAFMELSERYADNPSQLGVLEGAKEKVLDERLRQRMAGTLKAEVTDSPWDEKPVERIPPWVIAGEFLQKLFEIPTPKFALQVVGLIGGLTLASWISPNSAGTILLINVMSAMGFMYNRGQPDVVRDDFGQIGEIRPMKPKPMMVTCGFTFTLWMWGFFKAKRMVALAVIPKSFEVIVRGTLISAALTLAALVVKPHGLFD